VSDQVFCQSGTESLSVGKLSDGSTAIVDNRSKSVHSLNPSATLVWEACAKGATVAHIHAAVENQAGAPVDADAIRQALAQLQRVNLIESSSSPSLTTDKVDLGRRSLLKRAGAAGAFAIPVVLTLTAAEQKAYAFQSQSGTTTTPQPTG
jgi:hypothetical protein